MKATRAVVDTSQSPYATLKPVEVGQVKIRQGFWERVMRTNAEKSIPEGLRQLKEIGAVDNFYIIAGWKEGSIKGLIFQDSDLYKWIEGASWADLHYPLSPEIKEEINQLIRAFEAGQEEDGYLNTHFVGDRKALRFTNLHHDHEIYCAGHLIQAGIAHYRTTGEESLLGVARRFADLLYRLFGPGGKLAACGHPEAEMALVELYRVTREKKYLELADRMILARGQQPPVLGGSTYLLDHTPFRQQREATGHAVRALYLYAGATDLYAETGDASLLEALHALWEDIAYRKHYVTGGVGSRYAGEAIGEAYELPNLLAYSETCAAIAHLMWNWRMFLVESKPQYIDMVELTLYNGILSGVSIEGTQYFYVNPLESRGKHHRQPWYACACCPPNVHRTLATVPGYLFAMKENTLYVNLYADCQITTTLPSGQKVSLEMKTLYPWEGEVEIQPSPGTYQISLRIPGWAEGATVQLNGDLLTEGQPGTYLNLSRDWKEGDQLRLEIPMPVALWTSHPRVSENRLCGVLRRGPIIYCIEGHDVPEANLLDLYLPKEPSRFTPRWEPNLLGGIILLEGTAYLDQTPREKESLYHPLPPVPAQYQPVSVRAIPYYAWDNRGPAMMKVWFPLVE